MQRIVSLMRTITSPRTNLYNRTDILPSFFSTFKNVQNNERLLVPCTPLVNQVCSFKIKGRVKRRCKSCYHVVRDGRMYVICAKHPRHKQMAMWPKPHNTWILTHASQSPVRQW